MYMDCAERRCTRLETGVEAAAAAAAEGLRL